MGIYNQQDEGYKSELQKKVAAELREKLRTSEHDKKAERPDGIEDSAYIKGTKKTTSLAWTWMLIFFVFAAVIVWMMLRK